MKVIMPAVALFVLALDQFTKFLVLRWLDFAEEVVVVEGFFKFVHWGNTGAAWSLFSDNNKLLAVVSVAALILLFMVRRHFDMRTPASKIALGLLFGGIMGNLVDRLARQHVIDFLRFYIFQRGGGEVGFPAFNVADSAICVGVGLMFVLSWRNDEVLRGANSATEPST